MRNLLLTCLFGFIMIHQRECQPRVTLDVEELSAERVNLVVEFFFSPAFVINVTIDITSPSIPTSPTTPNVPLEKRAAILKDGIKLKRPYNIPVIGVQYVISVQVTARLGSLQEMLSVFEDVVIYNSAPLPPRYFNMSVDGDSANFMFLPPRNQSENGTPASYDYLVITCSSYYNNWTAEEGQTVSKIIDKTSDLVNYDEIVHLKWSLTDRLRGVFKHGSFIKCRLRAAAVQDITKYSQSLESSFVIAPVVPGVTLHVQEILNSTSFTIRLICNIDRSTEVFWRLQVHVMNNVDYFCRYNLSDLSMMDRFTCEFERSVSGVEHIIQVEVWSTGPNAIKKVVLHNVSTVRAPRPPKSMGINLIDRNVFINLDVGNLSTNIFSTVYFNSSDHSTAIVRLSTQNVAHPVKWRSLPPGTVNTFHCWTGVDINGKHYLSSHISADYTSRPSAPHNLIYQLNETDWARFEWEVDQQGHQQGFVLTICRIYDQSICLDKVNVTATRANQTKSILVMKINTTVTYTAWVQAVFREKLSERSNQIIIPGEDIIDIHRYDYKLSLVLVAIAGVFSILICGTLTAVMARIKMDWEIQRLTVQQINSASSINMLPGQCISSTFNNSRLTINQQPRISEVENTNVKKAAKRRAKKMKSQSILTPTLRLIDEN